MDHDTLIGLTCTAITSVVGAAGYVFKKLSDRVDKLENKLDQVSDGHGKCLKKYAMAMARVRILEQRLGISTSQVFDDLDADDEGHEDGPPAS